MRHWDYLVDRLMFPDVIDPRPERDAKSHDAYVQNWLKTHGGQGWELIEIQGSYVTGLIGVFKREILH